MMEIKMSAKTEVTKAGITFGSDLTIAIFK